MGEPPGAIQADIDVKPRLRRMYYAEAPKKYQQFRLGYAVGAPSCVPVLFNPLLLKDLYPGVDLQLVDGGLHDNQGIGSLIEQECNNMIISDASDQMPTDTKPTKGMGGVFYRADTLLQERLRELQFKDIQECNQTTQIRDLVKIHLKDGIQSKPVNWKGCQDPGREIMSKNPHSNSSDMTEYGVLRDVQLALSEIRTDLDSFHDTEAYALMYSGYQQTRFKLGISQNTPSLHKWDFLTMKKAMTEKGEAESTIAKLKLSKNLFFKGLQLMDLQNVLKWSILASLLVLAGFGIWTLQRHYTFAPMKALMVLGLGLVGIVVVFVLFMLFYRVYVWVFGPAYNRYGKV